MQLSQLWRYPMKSLAGEPLEHSQLGSSGLPGDRRVAAFEPEAAQPDKPVSARQRPALLKFRARSAGASVEVWGGDGPWAPWDLPEVAAQLGAACHTRLELRAVPEGAFDDSPILILHLATVRALGEELGRAVDPRRFRANLYLDGPGLGAYEEPGLLGRRLRVGRAVLEVAAVCPRCTIPTRDPDTWAVWPQLLRHLVQTRDEVAGAYCRIVSPGEVGVGDPAVLE
ncbi:MAG: MOSC domain-containing protein [Candidatus Dormibacteria bacterium]